MKTRTFILAGMVAACLAACTSDDNITDINSSYVDDGKSIKVEVTDEFAHAATRADYSGFPATEFEEGDQIGVYAVNTSNAAVASNIAFTRQSDGSWTPASSVVYNPDYTYYAYFPYKSSAPSFVPGGSGVDGKFTNFLNSNTFWVANQSSKANFTTSNLMWAEGTITGERTVKFTMAHKRGLAIISPAINQWYYSDNAGTKYNLTPVFSGNIPYELDGTRYFLMKPNTDTSVGGMSLRAGAGKYMTSAGIEMTGTPTYTYKVYHYGQSSYFSTSKPSWITITPNVVDGEPTELAVAVTNSTSTTYSKGSGNARNVPSDATLKAASPVSNVDLSMVDNSGNTRATMETANCYLVHAPGTYKIPLVYGNAIKNGETNSSAYHTTVSGSYIIYNLVNHANVSITSPWIKTQIGACPDGAQLVWEDVKGMISSVGIDDSENGYLTFTVDEDNIAEGNAVIAATLSGTIVWSWHVWVTTQTLSNLTAIDTGSHKNLNGESAPYRVAPVNVGQVPGTILSGATIYAGDFCTVTCTNNGVSMEFNVTAKDYSSGGSTRYYPCPYYQWGRKDAMYPSTGGFNSAGTLITTYSGTTRVTATSPGETIKHPDYWYYESTYYSPFGSTTTYGGGYNYWDMNQTSTGNKATATVKTVYDPCPPGFCVPTFNLYHFMGNSWTRNDETWTSYQGKTWSATTYSDNTTGDDLFFPIVGQRQMETGTLQDVASSSSCWSATGATNSSGGTLYVGNSYWGSRSSAHAVGLPVRPVAEE